jgi:N-acetylglutamate synthase-like GNAT family acetyltransferase
MLHTSEITIRKAMPADATPATEVMRRSIAELCVADHRNDVDILAGWLANKTPDIFTSWVESGDGHFYVAEKDGAILSVAAINISGEVTLNYVSPDARFIGVSKAMMAELEAKARELGLSACFLTSTETAHPFYLKIGYLDEETLTSPFTLQPAYHMRKRLA